MPKVPFVTIVLAAYYCFAKVITPNRPHNKCNRKLGGKTDQTTVMGSETNMCQVAGGCPLTE